MFFFTNHQTCNHILYNYVKMKYQQVEQQLYNQKDSKITHQPTKHISYKPSRTCLKPPTSITTVIRDHGEMIRNQVEE